MNSKKILIYKFRGLSISWFQKLTYKILIFPNISFLLYSLSVEIIYEIQYHLNALNSKCCKNWFFEIIFESFLIHNGRYFSHNLTNIGFWVLKSWRFTCINTVFRVAPQKKLNGVKWYDLGGQLISSWWEIIVEITYSSSRIL